MAIAKMITIPSITQKFGSRANRTSTTIFQQPGKPENELSFVFIRVSAKYITLVKVITMIAIHPVQPGNSPDLNKA